MKSARLFLLVLGLWLLPIVASARTQPSLEQTVAYRLAAAVQQWMATNRGALPSQWEAISHGVEDCNDRLLASRKHRVQALYVFFPSDFPALEQPVGKIVLGRYETIREGRLTGRYVIYEDPDHEVAATWVSEYDFDAMLAAYRKRLPEPIAWADVVKERSRRTLFLLGAILVLASGAIAWTLLRSFYKRAKPRL